MFTSSRLSALFGLGLAVFVVSGCEEKPKPTAECGPGVGDCGPGFDCVSGKCVAKPKPKAECSRFEDCPGGKVCVDGRCVACSGDNACPSGYECKDGGCRLIEIASQVTKEVPICDTLGTSSPKSGIVAYFDFDKSDLREDTKSALDQVAACVTEKGWKSVTVTGHCDERGTEGYNQALGQRRGAAAKRYLKGKLKDVKIQDRSAGENDAGQCYDEGCWQRDRKVVTGESK